MIVSLEAGFPKRYLLAVEDALDVDFSKWTGLMLLFQQQRDMEGHLPFLRTNMLTESGASAR